MSDMETRTAYGSESGTKQYINWVANDEIKVVMYNTTDHTCIYKIQSSTRNGDVDRASIGVKSGQTDLIWGTGSHAFYGVYPASATVTVTSSSSITMSGSIPSAVTVTVPSSGSDKTVVPDLSSAYMFARTSPVSARADAVNLLFNPAFTAYRFTLQNTGSSPVTIPNATLSSANYAICGDFTLDCTSWIKNTSLTRTAGTSSNKSITLTFTGGLTIEPSGTATFTFIGLPVTQNDLSLTANGKTLPLKSDASTWISFTAGKMNVVGTIALPAMDFLNILNDDASNGNYGIIWQN
jgi:hypothetical protein